jgi:hypothetical protein
MTGKILWDDARSALQLSPIRAVQANTRVLEVFVVQKAAARVRSS